MNVVKIFRLPAAGEGEASVAPVPRQVKSAQKGFLASAFLPLVSLSLAVCAASILLLANAPGTASARAEPPAKPSCAALSQSPLSTISTPLTQITSSAEVAAKEETPGYCGVDGYVKPQVGFRLLLPDRNWNRRFIEFGCSGHCGVLQTDECREPLRRGYACIVSDMGHRGTGSDGTWARNNLPAKLDLAYRGPHVTALAGKAIATQFYSSPPAHSYFMGCSNGGREALQEAQRFPEDFDGIVAGSPPIRFSEVYMMYAWAYQSIHGPDGHPVLGPTQFKLLHDAALANCDADYGLRDGVIENPLACRFTPATLLCRQGQVVACLSQDQVRSAEKIYAGPASSKGKRLSAGGPLPGSEYDSGVLQPPQWAAEPSQWAIFVGKSDGTPSSGLATAEQGFRYLLFDEDPPQSWRLADFNFDTDPQRLQEMDALNDSNNPDLSAFERDGGKLLIYSGLNDPVVLPRTVIEYYDKFVLVMSGQINTRKFARLYMLPGVGHCGVGSGAGAIDYLAAIENWVERGAAPDKLVASHYTQPGDDPQGLFPPVAGDIAFSRPVFPYPLQARFRSGDPTKENSFRSYDPEPVH